ncbi:TPA: hypothetical protein ONC27_002080 [Enterobacter asburiae]|uniref:Uncharacterized protein n=1 Tax=Enterobacter asburiae TaxID=61645 RepID=A0A7W3C7Z3_ENTAS|nr:MULTISPECIES: hypothetical protein [Enterobacter]EGQ5321357.1 hypothetical protein [Enterobacter asburiae]MBA7985899.1 hypothetical protein [Enterobacter asburiae]MBA8075944.1 hypothetical protein [Enterobacter asburiae]MEB2381705.1 hypothetical protein [Enterobacter sp. R-1.5.3]MEB2429943.1 hypothetical protein [Enterobacter sp. R-1.6.2]
MNYITFVDLFASVCAIKKEDFIPQKRRLCGLVLPSAHEEAEPQRAENALRASGDSANSVFIRGALFSPNPENIVVKADYL